MLTSDLMEPQFSIGSLHALLRWNQKTIVWDSVASPRSDQSDAERIEPKLATSSSSTIENVLVVYIETLKRHQKRFWTRRRGRESFPPIWQSDRNFDAVKWLFLVNASFPGTYHPLLPALFAKPRTHSCFPALGTSLSACSSGFRRRASARSTLSSSLSEVRSRPRSIHNRTTSC